MTGRLLVGTSGFAYPAWSPRFYPAGVRGGELLRYYGTRLDAVELNNTFYRQPRPEQVATWLAATPDDFRFVVKAQRSGSGRLLRRPDQRARLAHRPVPRLWGAAGAVLFRLPDIAKRDDDKLRRFLGAWPRDLPLVVELREPSWDVDETYRALADAGAALCITEMPEDEVPPTVRRTAERLYLRLRRHDYTSGELEAWRDRLRAIPRCRRRRLCVLPPRRGGPWRRAGPRFPGTGGCPSTGVDRLLARERLCRAEHDEGLEALGDVVEPVRDAACDEDQRAGPDRTLLVADGDRGLPRDDEIQLVLSVGLLRIGIACLEDVQACAEVGDPQELLERFPAALRIASTSPSSNASISPDSQRCRCPG